MFSFFSFFVVVHFQFVFCIPRRFIERLASSSGQKTPAKSVCGVLQYAAYMFRLCAIQCEIRFVSSPFAPLWTLADAIAAGALYNTSNTVSFKSTYIFIYFISYFIIIWTLSIAIFGASQAAENDAMRWCGCSEMRRCCTVVFTYFSWPLATMWLSLSRRPASWYYEQWPIANRWVQTGPCLSARAPVMYIVYHYHNNNILFISDSICVEASSLARARIHRK